MKIIIGNSEFSFGGKKKVSAEAGQSPEQAKPQKSFKERMEERGLLFYVRLGFLAVLGSIGYVIFALLYRLFFFSP